MNSSIIRSDFSHVEIFEVEIILTTLWSHRMLTIPYSDCFNNEIKISPHMHPPLRKSNHSGDRRQTILGASLSNSSDSCAAASQRCILPGTFILCSIAHARASFFPCARVLLRYRIYLVGYVFSSHGLTSLRVWGCRFIGARLKF